jgi:DNA-binding response OmpR family regulator
VNELNKQPSSQSGKAKILAVEDDYLTRRMLQITLSKYFDVFVCGCNRDFYEFTKNNDCDLFLMDISLRDSKDGCDLTKELRKTEKFRNKPIIALTAYSSNKERKKAMDAGVDLFLTKPILPNDLLTELKKFI